MKKIIIATVILLVVGFTTNAQITSKHVLGLRLGDNHGVGGEISYQPQLSAKSRLEIDLGFRDDSRKIKAFKLVGLYQWVMPIEDHFNWYVGVGAGVGSFRNHYKKNDEFDDAHYKGSFGLAAGDIGIEYNFDFPLQLSFDIRPELAFNNHYRDNLGIDVGVGVRYRFLDKK